MVVGSAPGRVHERAQFAKHRFGPLGGIGESTPVPVSLPAIAEEKTEIPDGRAVGNRRAVLHSFDVQTLAFRHGPPVRMRLS